MAERSSFIFCLIAACVLPLVGAVRPSAVEMPAVVEVAEVAIEPVDVWATLVPNDDRPRPPAVTRVRVVAMEVTAYCGGACCCGDHADGVTASGEPITHDDGRFVAADTGLLPFGTRLRVPGYADERFVPVLDRGSAIVGNRLDVFFPDHATAVEWGRRTLDVEVLETIGK
jgi:3D (Asp-Asp-Asp) domain-containing protein